VPTTHPLYQFIEALYNSNITGGCSVSPPLYCPDAPVTRGEVAVFLATALGLGAQTLPLSSCGHGAEPAGR
jgi:hypothetical protein